jgi:hypothetical protein
MASDRLGVGCVILVARHIGLHPLRRQQSYLMPQAAEFTRPIMRRTAGFDADPNRSQLLEKPKNLPPPQPPAQHRLFGRVDTMKLKNALGRVHTNADKMVHGRLPRLRSQRPHSGTSMPSGAVHPNMNTAR